MLKPKEIYTFLGTMKVLNAVTDIIAPSVADLFNASIKAKIFLDDFKITRVTPIFKVTPFTVYVDDLAQFWCVY